MESIPSNNLLEANLSDLDTRFGQYALHYVVQPEPYQGAGTGFTTQHRLGYGVVKSLVERLPTSPAFHIFMDNYFSGFKLFKDLKEIGIGATGTIRANRIEKCPIDLKIMKKLKRGSIDLRHDRTDDIIVCAWNDNSVVTLASNECGVFPLAKANRWCRQEKKIIQLDQPSLVHKYNLGMGGVDRTDQNISAYRITIRSKKCWWPLFSYLCDIALSNAWLLYRKSPSNSTFPLDQLAFKRSVALVYMKLHLASKYIPDSPNVFQRLKRQKVFQGVKHSSKGHNWETLPKQRRCRYCGKKGNLLCIVCNVPLHRRRSAAFHS